MYFLLLCVLIIAGFAAYILATETNPAQNKKARMLFYFEVIFTTPSQSPGTPVSK